MNMTILTLKKLPNSGSTLRYSCMRSLLLVLPLTFLPIPSAEADVDPALIGEAFRSHFPESSNANQLAMQTLKNVLPNLIGHDNDFASRLGFASASDVDPLHLSVKAPYPLLIVDLDQLKGISAQCLPQSPNNGLFLLSRDRNWRQRSAPLLPWRFLYPIKVDNAVKSSVTIASASSVTDAEAWKIERIGSSTLIAMLDALGTSAGHFVIWIPALNRYYLGSVNTLPPDQYTFSIRTVFADRTLNVPANTVMPAWEAFCRLNKEAVNIDPSGPPR